MLKFGSMMATLFCVGSCLCCAGAPLTLMSNNARDIETIKNPKQILPIKAFVLIKKTQILKRCNTNSCQTKTSRSSGSGAIISRNAKGSRVITAGHVCKYKNPVFALLGIKVASEKMSIVTRDGADRPARIVMIDKINDICILDVPNLTKYKPVKISPKAPEVGDRIFNIAAPRGIFAKNFALIYEGYYAGKMEGKAWYSNFATRGSSGSMILNNRGELIGIVTHAMPDVTLAIGPYYSAVTFFIYLFG